MKAAFNGIKPCITGIILAMGVSMIGKNCMTPVLNELPVRFLRNGSNAMKVLARMAAFRRGHFYLSKMRKNIVKWWTITGTSVIVLG